MFFLAVTLLAEGALVANLMLRQSGHNFLAAVISSEIISLTNSQRAQNKVPTLVENTLLKQSAQAKADDMAARGYFAHKGPDGKEPWVWIDAAGYEYQYAGENLAVRFVDSKDVFVAWMASPTHRANIVKSTYSEVGVGISQGSYKGQPATFVVQHFGKPTKAALAARAQGAVLGAETGPAPWSDTFTRNFGRLLSEPRATTAWVLGVVAAVLMLALAFAFFHHIQLQARDLLLPGGVVASIAFMLLAFNGSYLSATTVYTGHGAGAASAAVVLTPAAESMER